MRCVKCGQDNLLQANYCCKCGCAFTEEEKQAAYDKTIYGILDKIEDLWATIKLDKITGNLVFRIAVLVLIAVVGIASSGRTGTDFAVLDGKTYDVQYNQRSGEYYILSPEQVVQAELYIPGEPESLTLNCLDVADTVVESMTYSLDEGIALDISDRVHYQLVANYADHTDTIVIFTYLTE